MQDYKFRRKEREEPFLGKGIARLENKLRTLLLFSLISFLDLLSQSLFKVGVRKSLSCRLCCDSLTGRVSWLPHAPTLLPKNLERERDAS